MKITSRAGLRLMQSSLLTKTLRIMRMMAILLTAFCIQVSGKSLSQTITFSGNKVPLAQVLEELKRQTNFFVIYNSTQLKSTRPVSIDAQNMPLTVFMDKLLRNQPLQYSLQNTTIFITQKEAEVVAPKFTNASAHPITGVVNGPGGPIAGANIIVKGTKRGTITNADGSFSIDAKEGEVLIISSIGFTDRQITISSFNVGSVLLTLADNKLDEVQIIAYGTTTKRFNTSNLGSVTAKEIERQPVTNPLLALQGRVPGLFIQQTSGNTAGSVSTLIQGRNSINNGTEPFFVIDGIPYSPNMVGSTLASANFTGPGSAFNFINPTDIESVEILKDADATAIYGSRAANGAILITTKKAKAGQTKVDIAIQSGAGEIARRARLANTSQYLEIRREAYVNDGYPVPNTSSAPDFSNFDLTIWDPNKNHDWQEELVGGTATFTNVQASVSGGSERTRFLASAGYNRQGTVYPTNLRDAKYNGRVNLDHTSENKKFIFNTNLSFLRSNNTLPSEDLMGRALSFAPNAPDLYKEDGSINWGAYPNSPNQYSFSNNPVAFLLRKYTSVTDNLLANASLSYEIIEGLQLKSTFGYNKLTANEVLITPTDAIRPDLFNREGSSDFLNKITNSYIIEPQLTYSKTTSSGVFNFLVGTSFQETSNNATGYRATGFSNSNQLSNLSAATNITSLNADLQSLYKYNALFGRINYRLHDKYVVNISARRDGSSKFGASNKLHDFYSVGIAWLFAEEDWIRKHLPKLSTGKLRVSYGTLGNDQLPDYSYESLLENVGYSLPYQNLTSTRPFRHSNPYLQWEETKKLNIGIDLGLYDDRITFSGNYFRNRSSNQLISYQLPALTGFTFVTANFDAVVQNSGFEMLLNAMPIKFSNLDWQVSLNATIPKNKLSSFRDFENSSYTKTYIIGQPVNVIVNRYKYEGVNPETGYYQFQKADGTLTSNPSAATDRTQFIDPNPKWYGGITNSLRYKNFTVDILFQYVNRMGRNDRFISGIGNLNINVPVYVYENRWRQKGQVTDVEKVSNDFPVSSDYADGSDSKFSDASFLRLKNASISYSLPAATLKMAHLQMVRIYVQGQNMLTVTKFRGIDPESGFYNSLPPLKMYTAGLQITF